MPPIFSKVSHSMSKRLRTVIIVIAVLVVLVMVLVFVRQRQQVQDIQSSTTDTAQVAPEVADAVTEVIPETSPTKNTNPFSGTYKNPFE